MSSKEVTIGAEMSLVGVGIRGTYSLTSFVSLESKLRAPNILKATRCLTKLPATSTSSITKVCWSTNNPP